MANRIKLLPEVVANQIAAGEVVNRPASVVKEMMENAIDAGAGSIKVNFRDGGKELIQIVDDGCGMSPIDARLAFDRHATSKIRSVDDIYQLSTFGFRGEALPSIAAVAQVELRSRQEGDELGTQTEINGGEFAGQSPVMCPVGSQFFVRNLFFNVPARRRFLDKSTTSATQIKNEFRRVALCYPKVAFELYANDAPVYSLMPSSLAGRIVDIVGKHIKPNLLDVSADTSIASITGFIGRPSAAKKRNAEQYLFVNGRFFKSGYIVSAILKAYEKLIPTGTQPAFFLYLTIDTSRIDVNVHPQKTEVKFSDEEAVWQIVNAAVRETLGKTGAVPMMDFDHEEAVDIPVLNEGTVYNEPRAMSNSTYNPFAQEFTGGNNYEPTEDFTGFDLPEGGGHQHKEEEFEEFGSDAEFGAGQAQAGAICEVQQPVAQDFDAAQSTPPAFMRGEGAMPKFLGGTGTDTFLAGDDFEQEMARVTDFSALPVTPRKASAGGTFARSGFDPRMSAMGVGSEEFEDFSSKADETDDFEDFVSELDASGNKAQNNNISAGQGGFSDHSALIDIEDDSESFTDFQPMDRLGEGADTDRSELDFSAQAVAEQTNLGLTTDHHWGHPIVVRGATIVVQLDGRLMVVDADRARERIAYERYIAMLDRGSALSEQLLFPERLELSHDEYTLLEEHAVEIAALGFDIEFRGAGAIDVKGTPADIPSEGIDTLLFELLQAFSEPVDLELLRREKIARVMARQGLRTSARTLTEEEINELLTQLFATPNFSFSPSGKLILAEIAVEKLRALLG